MQSHPLKLRLFVALLMLILGFIGVVITDINKDGGWRYWEYIAIVYALLSLFLNWRLKVGGWKTTLITVWHEIAHWAGLLGAIWVVAYAVDIGLLSRFLASFEVLTLLALATFLAGLYIEKSYLLIGICLGLFAVGLAFFAQYLYTLFLPIVAVVALIMIVWIYYNHRKSHPNES